jgi:hypothetical protein
MAKFSQLIVNGDFKKDISNWTDNSGGSSSIAWNAGEYMELNYVDAYVIANQSFNTVVGKKYQATIENVGSVSFYAYEQNAAGSPLLGTVPANSSLTATFIADYNTTSISLRLFAAGTAKVGSVRVQKLSPFNDIIKPADVPTSIFNDIIRTFA